MKLGYQTCLHSCACLLFKQGLGCHLGDATWLWPRAGVVPKRLEDVLNENAPPDWPSAGLEPNRLGVLLGVEKLPPKRLGVLEAPKAGVLEAPKRLAPDDAPNAGVLLPNKEGVLAAEVKGHSNA